MLKKLLKKRKYTLKDKLYIEADYLNKTVFKKGTGITYNIDYVNKSVTVVTTNEKTRNHVSGVTQTRTKKVVPTIDIRKSDVREFLKNVGQLEVSIYEDKIIFSAIANENEQLDETILKDADNNVVELATYRDSKAKSFALDIHSTQFAVGCNESYIRSIFQNTSDFFNPKQLKKKTIDMISLFSGCGMLDKGFLDNGNYNIKFAIDMFEKKRLRRYHIETYKRNIGNHIVEGDILELKKEDIVKADFVVGGVPCVKFSKLNSKDNFRNSKTTEFPLLEQFLNVVEWSGAKGFLIENVKEFVTIKGGALVERIKERLSDFNIICKIVNPSDLGSAQARKRAFILGMKKAKPVIDLPYLGIVKTVRDAFTGVEKDPQHDLRLELKDNYLEMAKYIPQGGNLFDVPEDLRPNRSFGNCIQRLHYDRPAPTITGIDSDYILHPVEDRKISVGEIKRLFSLPEDFILQGSVTSMVTQLKNGVDYKVARFFADTIYKQMCPIL